MCEWKLKKIRWFNLNWNCFDVTLWISYDKWLKSLQSHELWTLAYLLSLLHIFFVTCLKSAEMKIKHAKFRKGNCLRRTKCIISWFSKQCCHWCLCMCNISRRIILKCVYLNQHWQDRISRWLSCAYLTRVYFSKPRYSLFALDKGTREWEKEKNE